MTPEGAITPEGAHLDGPELAALLADPRRAVTEDAIVCLLCGGRFRQLTNTHLRGHGMTADEYKRRFGYNRRRALMCGSLRLLYAERALRTGLALRIGWRPIVQEPELRRRGGMRPTTLEERLTRAERRSNGLRAGLALVALMFLSIVGVADAAAPIIDGTGAPRTLGDVAAGDFLEYRDEPFAAMRIAMELRVVTDLAPGTPPVTRRRSAVPGAQR